MRQIILSRFLLHAIKNSWNDSNFYGNLFSSKVWFIFSFGSPLYHLTLKVLISIVQVSCATVPTHNSFIELLDFIFETFFWNINIFFSLTLTVKKLVKPHWTNNNLENLVKFWNVCLAVHLGPVVQRKNFLFIFLSILKLLETF